jgi:sortase family protein
VKPSRGQTAALALIVLGLTALLLGAPSLLESLRASWEYSQLPVAERAARPAALLEVREPGPTEAITRPSPTRLASRAEGAEDASLTAELSAGLSQPPRYAGRDGLELVNLELRFDDPPEAGARARLVVDLRNHGEQPSTPLVLAIPNDWFEHYRLLGASPELLDDRPFEADTRLLTLAALDPGASASYELHLTALDDEISVPEPRLLLADGTALDGPQLRLIGPRPRPGLARTLLIPRLNLQANVVQTVWEPPRFVVGQIQGSALLGEGNSVLVGHLNGPAGDVFAHLDQLRPGDEVVAVSRGLEYRFVVSQTLLRRNDDSSPLDPTPSPRLTLMTCAGTWNPLTHDYSHRVWVIAEPPDLAAVTIAARAEAPLTEPGPEPAARGEAVPTPAPSPLASPPTTPPASVAAVLPSASAVPPPSLSTTPLVDVARPNPRLERRRPLASRRGSPPLLTAERSARLALSIESPASRALVDARLNVRGRLTVSSGPPVRAWLVVRAHQPGARWYAYPGELPVRADGSWQADLTLGGASGVRHELWIGLVDAETSAALSRQVAARPNQPLDQLPPGFWPVAMRLVTRR